MQVVIFRLERIDYALDIRYVQEILGPQEPTKIPGTPIFVEGVINLRDKIIPVINLCQKFGLNQNVNSAEQRLVVLETAVNKHIAIKTEHVSEVLTIDEKDIEQPPSLSNNETQHCVQGIIKLDNRLIVLLNRDNLIDAEIMPQLSS